MAQTYDLTEDHCPCISGVSRIPAAIGLVFTTMYNVVDVFFAGLIGTEGWWSRHIIRGLLLHHFRVWAVVRDDGACRQCSRCRRAG